jgi:hypothetical protein
MALDFLLGKVKDLIYDDDNTTYKRGDNHGLIGQVEDLFGQITGRPRQSAPGTIDNPLPASQDPYGDPADLEPQQRQYAGNRPYSEEELYRQYPNLRPASQDPHGDPADLEHDPDALRRQYPNLRPASQDPYGDPADLQPQRARNNVDDLRQRFPNLRPASEDPYGDPADR